VTVSFAVQKGNTQHECLGSCSPICQSFILTVELLGLYSLSYYLCLCGPMNFVFFPGSILVSDLTLRSVIHFELMLAGTRWETGIQFQSYACGNPLYPAPFVKEVIFSTTYILGAFIEKSNDYKLHWIVSWLSWSSYLFWASTVMFSLRWLCRMVWSQVFWNLQHCFPS
jgi:hypothetical protein